MKYGNKNKIKFGGVKKYINFFIKPALMFVLLAALIVSAVNNADKSGKKESIELIEKNIKKAAISCYAIEGRYPADFEYLVKNYGLSINTDKYCVFYSIFATNIMPDITVTEK